MKTSPYRDCTEFADDCVKTLAEVDAILAARRKRRGRRATDRNVRDLPREILHSAASARKERLELSTEIDDLLVQLRSLSPAQLKILKNKLESGSEDGVALRRSVDAISSNQRIKPQVRLRGIAARIAATAG